MTLIGDLQTDPHTQRVTIVYEAGDILVLGKCLIESLVPRAAGVL